jgi:hypothetical protein
MYLITFFLAVQIEELIVNLAGVVVHACNPSTQEAEAGGFPVQGQAGLPSKTLSQ